MSERDWFSVPVVTVPMMAVRPQKLAPPWWALLKVLLVMAHVLKPRSGDHYPHLVQEAPGVGSYIIEDGHHRITVLSLLGCKELTARIVWAGDSPFQNKPEPLTNPKEAQDNDEYPTGGMSDEPGDLRKQWQREQ